VSSAPSLAQFYNTKVTQARDLTSKLTNDDRDGVYGFDTKAARAFADQAGLTAYTLLAAAEGAVHTYAAITGDDWKPCEVPLAPAATINRKSAPPSLMRLPEAPRRGSRGPRYRAFSITVGRPITARLLIFYRYAAQGRAGSPGRTVRCRS
jgi:hypothetical protein